MAGTRWVALSLSFPICKMWMILPASQGPLGLLWADARGAPRAEEVTKCQSVPLLPTSLSGFPFLPHCPPPFLSGFHDQQLECSGSAYGALVPSDPPSVPESSPGPGPGPGINEHWLWHLCSPVAQETGALDGCLCLTAQPKGRKEISCFRRWSLAREIHYRFKPVWKMHLQLCEPEWKPGPPGEKHILLPD